MVVLNKIYTRTGDGGQTALSDGSRVSKTSVRVEAYGCVDELNSIVGLARFACASNEPLEQSLARIQNDLFDLGADLCTPESDASPSQEPKRKALRMHASHVERLEAEIDAINVHLAPLRSFILPGGTHAAACLHMCRTTCRRAERTTLALAQAESLNPEALRYLNRLSDWFFVAARNANDNGAKDILWVPGENL